MGDKQEMSKIEVEMKFRRETTKTHLFEEVLGETQWSDQDVALGTLYVKIQALKLIGSPKKIKVTIEPID